jgi:hypothetical protein
MRRGVNRALLLALAVMACSPPPMMTPEPDSGMPPDAGAPDAGAPDSGVPDAGPADAGDKSATCASTFGSALTASFGRLDGTILAVLPPNDQACALPNSTHLILQVTMNGEAYRMVVDVHSTVGTPDVWFYEQDGALLGGAWADGWHTGIGLDYLADLQLHSTQFTEMTTADLVPKVTSELELGAHVSVFATSGSTEPNSAHLVHRNIPHQDGAIVINPDGPTPHWMFLRFGEQSF